MDYKLMIKIVYYTLMITILGTFTILGTNDLSASNNTKKCVCPSVKTIKNQKYNCTISNNGKNICKKVSVKNSKTRNDTTKKTAYKKTKNQTKKNQTKVDNKIVDNSKKAVGNKSSHLSETKKSVNPLIIVNRFEEDPTFLASITGILYGINENIDIIDVAHIDETKDIILQSYKLLKTSSMWKENAVFISGSNKTKIEPTIIVVKSKNNQFFVTQNSGVITFIKDTVGISEVRKLQRVNFKSETLNGRDVEYLIGAKLIDNPANFDKMGEPIEINQLNTFNYTPLKISQQGVSSLFVVEDKENGNIFTFIQSDQFNKFNPKDNDVFKVVLSNGINIILIEEAIYKNSRTYYDGTEPIVLDYKSSIGTYIAIKNLQNNKLSTLENNDRSYKIEITPIHKEKPIAISNVENTNVVAPQNVTTPINEEKSISTHSSIEATTQNPTESNIKDVQIPKKTNEDEVTSKDIYPSAGRTNIAVEPEKVDIDEKEILEEEKEILEEEEEILEEEEEILEEKNRKLASNNTKTQNNINSLEAEKAIRSNNSIGDDLLYQNSKDIQRDNQNIKNIKEVAPRGPMANADAHVNENDKELVTGIRNH